VKYSLHRVANTGDGQQSSTASRLNPLDSSTPALLALSSLTIAASTFLAATACVPSVIRLCASKANNFFRKTVNRNRRACVLLRNRPGSIQMDLKSAVMILLLFATIIVLVGWIGRKLLNKRALKNDYASLSAYLPAIPVTDGQKLDAVDLALKGGVIVILGVLCPPLIFVGLVPLYYGVRKITMTLMGLGLSDHL
jgi:hypothetical protein